MAAAPVRRRLRRVALGAAVAVTIAIVVIRHGRPRAGVDVVATATTAAVPSQFAGAAARDTAVPGSPTQTSSPVLAAVPADSTRPTDRGRPDRAERIRVRVLNTTGVHGLARRMTFLLRDAGFDVVDFDSDLKQRAAETRILVHSAHPEWAERVRQAIGVGTAVIRPDSLRALDLTVLIGPDWRAPAQPLRP